MSDGTPEGRSTVTTEKNMRKSEHLLLGKTQRAPNVHRSQSLPTLKKQPTPTCNPRRRDRSRYRKRCTTKSRVSHQSTALSERKTPRGWSIQYCWRKERRSAIQASTDGRIRTRHTKLHCGRAAACAKQCALESNLYFNKDVIPVWCP